MLKISMQMMGCGERSKFSTRTARTRVPAAKLMFLERERERESVAEEVPGKGAWGAQAPCGRGQGPGRATWPPGPGVAPPGQPQVPLRHIFDRKIYFNFSGIFLTTSFLKIFRGSESCKNFRRARNSG